MIIDTDKIDYDYFKKISHFIVDNFIIENDQLKNTLPKRGYYTIDPRKFHNGKIPLKMMDNDLNLTIAKNQYRGEINCFKNLPNRCKSITIQGDLNNINFLPECESYSFIKFNNTLKHKINNCKHLYIKGNKTIFDFTNYPEEVEELDLSELNTDNVPNATGSINLSKIKNLKTLEINCNEVRLDRVYDLEELIINSKCTIELSNCKKLEKIIFNTEEKVEIWTNKIFKLPYVDIYNNVEKIKVAEYHNDRVYYALYNNNGLKRYDEKLSNYDKELKIFNYFCNKNLDFKLYNFTYEDVREQIKHYTRSKEGIKKFDL